MLECLWKSALPPQMVALLVARLEEQEPALLAQVLVLVVVLAQAQAQVQALVPEVRAAAARALEAPEALAVAPAQFLLAAE